MKYFLLAFTFLFSFQLQAEDDLINLIRKKIPGAEITELEVSDHFKKEYEILIPQKLDHFDKNNKETFQQRIFLYHYDRKAPTVFVTEGYSARQRHYELAEIIMGNQIQVEYRYFGKSKPADQQYKYLNNDQAMEDLHYIRHLFCKVYKKEWISTGISKGGTTCLIYKSKYPKDVKVAVPYVAPLPFNQTDKRCDDAILTNGTAECRDKLEAFQHAVLDNREIMLVKADSLAKSDSMSFTRFSLEEVLEYAVLEFTFSFWQWGHNCDLVDPSVSPDSLFKTLNNIVGLSFYSDATCDYFEPSYYQFMKENGYYSFIHEPFKGKLKALKRYDNLPFGPQELDLEMDKDYLKYVRVWLYHNGDKIIHVQGELDPWGACGFVPPEGQDALLMINKNGSHTTRIRNLSSDQQVQVYERLDHWLKAKIHPLKVKKKEAE